MASNYKPAERIIKPLSMFVFIQKQEKSLTDVSSPKENLSFHVVSSV